jgi:CDP-4-dehydro-6-deoxyglucose reductase, E3
MARCGSFRELAEHPMIAFLRRFPSLAAWIGYICGDPPLVNSLCKKLFLAGMASEAIFSDAFLPSVTRRI